MLIPTLIQRCVLVGLLAFVLSFAPLASANQRAATQGQDILIRRTIPDPFAVKRLPLTSDQLSTTSTRLIDARRGFRPFSSVHRDCALPHRFAGYDDHFGISRPQNRPYSYSQRTPRTFVSQFRNPSRESMATSSRVRSSSPAVTIVFNPAPAAAAPKPEMKIRIHNDASAIPTTSGAVLVRSDGTVIQIGH
jgi:hypothetical protein